MSPLRLDGESSSSSSSSGSSSFLPLPGPEGEEEKSKGERERDLFQVITLSKYVLKIIVHYSLLDLRSNMVITDLLPGAPWMFLLAVLLAILAAHPVYISN